MISCKTKYKISSYEFDRGLKFENVNGTLKPFPKTYIHKSIILISDSTLNYTVRYGDIGASTTIKYKITDNVMIIDSIDIYNRKSFQSYTNEIFENNFLYSKDSLTDIGNNDKYYVDKVKKH
jgi:hypothetical protein